MDDLECGCREFIRHENELRLQWEKAHEDLHKVEADALRLAREEIKEWKHDVNNVRQQINTERSDFVRRDLHDKLEQSMDQRLKVLELARSNQEGRLWMMGAAISAVVVVINLLMHYYGVVK